MARFWGITARRMTAVLALLTCAVVLAAGAAAASPATAPVVKKVRARTVATTAIRTTWELTATASDSDADLAGGRVNVVVGTKGSVLSRAISQRTPRLTTPSAGSRVTSGISTVALKGRALRVVFFASPAPGPLIVRFWVTDARRHASPRVTLHLMVKASATVSITATAAGAGEPDLPGEFAVTRTGSTSAPLTVGYTVGGTASATYDFTALPGSITIPAGQTRATIAVTPVDDDAIETVETVVITLVASNGYLVSPPGSASVSITSDDTLGTVSISDLTTSAAEPSTAGSFTLTRTGSLTASVVVSYSLMGTATSGLDYRTLSGSAIIPAGQADVEIAVTPIDDTVIEPAETIVVTIRASSRYTVGSDASATLTIVDNDSASIVTVTATDSSASEPNGTGTFTITRTGSITTALTVAFTLGGTAVPGTDYTTTPSSPVTIPAGSTTAAITVTPIDDSVVESSETVVATLSAASSDYTVGSSNSATATIADDEPTVTIEASDAAAAEPADPGMFTVTRTGSTTSSLVVYYTVTGTATNGGDYTALAGSVTIAVGQASATITVAPISDAVSEGDETVIVTLTSTAGYAVGSSASATVTVSDAP